MRFGQTRQQVKSIYKHDMSSTEVNRSRLLWAGFMAILAAGVGFGIRGGIFDNWAGDFGFTALQLGAIGGAGFTGFCFGIIIGGIVVDKIGYGKLVFAAVACHILSAVVTFGATTLISAKNSQKTKTEKHEYSRHHDSKRNTRSQKVINGNRDRRNHKGKAPLDRPTSITPITRQSISNRLHDLKRSHQNKDKQKGLQSPLHLIRFDLKNFRKNRHPRLKN